MKTYRITRRNSKGQLVATVAINAEDRQEAEAWVKTLSNHDGATFTIAEEA